MGKTVKHKPGAWRAMCGLYNKRKEMGKTQAEFGLLVGVSGTSISTWETGKYYPAQQFLDKILHVFGFNNVHELYSYKVAIPDESQLVFPTDPYEGMPVRGNAPTLMMLFGDATKILMEMMDAEREVFSRYDTDYKGMESQLANAQELNLSLMKRIAELSK